MLANCGTYFQALSEARAAAVLIFRVIDQVLLNEYKHESIVFVSCRNMIQILMKEMYGKKREDQMPNVC